LYSLTVTVPAVGVIITSALLEAAVIVADLKSADMTGVFDPEAIVAPAP
jgi:hypothetical protein